MPRNPRTGSKSRAEPMVIRTIAALRAEVARARGRGDNVALVPTMGALHAGHLALVRAARHRARHVVVSVFVNPAQFAPNEDFGSYPRTWDQDLAALAALKADLVWAPHVKDMSPEAVATHIEPGGPAQNPREDGL